MRRSVLWVTTILLVLVPSAAYGGDWRMFHHDAVRGGGTPETTIGASTASSLTPLWQANTGAPAYTSPAVVKSPVSGKTLVYVANTAGTLTAYDAATGDRVWYFDLPVKINSSPAVVNNVLYIGASDHNIYALNATTGAQICHLGVGNNVEASPVVGNPGDGNAVYVGDEGITGADDGGHMWAMTASNCALKWSYNAWGSPPGSQPLVGSWSPPAFAKDATGRPLVVFGGSSPEGAVYALDARTGARVWRFQTLQWKADQDVGAAPTISLPGANGFKDGVVYVTGKDAIVYALNLTTGALVWSFSIKDDSPLAPTEDRSSAALVGDKLVLGYGGGVYELNAITGAKVWNSADTVDTPEIISSPAVSGAAGNQVALVGDMGGTIRAFDVATGQQRWSYATGATVVSSPAIAYGVAYIASADGYLYAFALGGSVSGRPDTTIDAPSTDIVTNPKGNLTLSGTATDDLGVSKVLVAVRNVNNGKWWNAASKTWSGVFTQAAATLGTAGAKSTTWRSSFPVPSTGGSYFMQAEAVDGSKQGDPVVAQKSFAVTSLGKPPETAITAPAPFAVFNLPSPRKSITVPFSGTATDSGGTHPGISRVAVTVINTDHSEYYCGPGGCPQSSTGTFWRTEPISFNAVLSTPGAATTNWHATFPSYDHPHRYTILAQAFDKDGEMDVTKASVTPVCVKDAGDKACP